MIDPCPVCGKTPEPVKASYEVFNTEHCGIKGKPHPWFMGAIRNWNRAVKEWRKEHEVPDLPKGD